MPSADVLRSARLELWPVRLDDVDALAQLGQDPVVRAHLGGPLASHEALDRARQLVDRDGCCAVRWTGDPDLLGVVTLMPGHDEPAELSYWFDPRVWGQGIAREAAVRVLAEVAEVDVRVIAVTQASNPRSIRLLESLGFDAERELVEYGERQMLYATVRSGRATAS